MAGVAILVGWILFMQRGAYVHPEGKVLKVRTAALDEYSSIAVIDFRLVNDSDVRLEVRDVTVTYEDRSGKVADGMIVAEMDAKKLFQYYPVLGQKFNDTLVARDRIDPRQTMDRMIAARFELPLAQLDARKTLTVRITDVDHHALEFSESR